MNDRARFDVLVAPARVGAVIEGSSRRSRCLGRT